MAKGSYWTFLGSFRGGPPCGHAFDCSVAISRPPQYVPIMDPHICCFLEGVCWAVGVLHSVEQSLVTFFFPFCDSNIKDHSMYDVFPGYNLSALTLDSLLVAASGGITSVITFVMWLVFYVVILCSWRLIALQGGNNNNNKKALSTCSLPITVAVFFCLFPVSSSCSVVSDSLRSFGL